MKEGKSTPREFEQQREVKLFLGMSAPELAEETRADVHAWPLTKRHDTERTIACESSRSVSTLRR